MEYLISIKFGVVNIFVENKGGGGRKHYFGNFLSFEGALIVGG